MKKYLKMREEYKDDIYSFYEDTEKVKELFGEENIEKYIACNLELSGGINTNKTALNERRSITFFPRSISKSGKFFHKPTRGYAYTIGFNQDTMTFVGFDDYYEINYYDVKKRTITDSEFIDLIDTTENVHEWLVNYARKLKNE